ncbi:putative P-loop containing nucleoside triphosphate hydrolase, leucine-rich repeat domain, L [Medicago truncatula]|uniref:Putative P-loop containing nucleoside triphosphate hydrolase, leucine-rich repeat domain, L n=1 Tax=Medicago truncatula TaxID=3880 RepID=A0A396ILM3_MEDTR|nr:putative disease resistance RPP13-like protein 1 [Medicago truncatula]RHN65658.1 putative P-loop containing nucleoside triphosphate hydrolase, leucine-rich repeat domain, L [Medicago truncatula]
MATIVGEGILSASVKLLLQKIVSGEFINFFRNMKLDVPLLDKLKITLLSLQAVLNDAEEKQIANSAVKEWLNMLQDAVFEAEDLFDEINTESLRCRVEAEYETQSAKVLKKLSSRFKRFNRKMNSKLQKLLERLEHLRNQNHGLKEGVSNSVWHGTPTSSVVGDESAIYGRDDDRKKLKEFLLAEDVGDGRSKIGVISIVGMGGLGKTTLAKLLYNDHDVKQKFEVRGWAHVSKDLNVVTVTKTLLESVTSEKTTANELNILQVKLQQSLRNKSFLLVLDDIWYGRYVGWNSMNDIFNVGAIGSKIIITTRDERVALPMQTFLYVHHVRSLETEDCWNILASHAFVERNYQQQPDLEKIGREIAKKCDGIRLAAIALRGLLRTKLSQDYWNDVLKSSIWELTNDEVQPSLLLSYRYLPAPLKGCFAYCSIFSKNSILKKKMVVQLWIAEGLVPQPQSEKSWEKVAEEYFDELVSRCLIRQRSIDDLEVSFEMHDLINDLATIVSSPYCIRLEEHKPHERVRHLSYNRGIYDSYDKFDKLDDLKGLRTFLSLPLQEVQWLYYSVSGKLVCDLLPQMKQLHALSLLKYSNIIKLPKSIGSLIYLRYLNLSDTMIGRLPSETCKLYNLQTLLLTNCWNLTNLPKDMGKLVSLRHLDIRGTQLKEMPVQLSKLENLQTLSSFVVSKQDIGLKIADLGKYFHLQGRLSISQLQNVTDPSHAFQANLEMKKQMDELVLGWSDDTPSNSQIQSAVFEQLRPSTNLKSLTIFGYGGNSFPNWLGCSLFDNIVYLRIAGCENCSRLPPLGQLGNLKKLFLGNLKSVKSVGSEFYGRDCPSFQPFPLLETLRFHTMLEWEEWTLTGGTSTKFPRLTQLSLIRCPKLKGNIPLGQLGNLKELIIVGMKSVKTLGTEFYGSSSSPLIQPFLSLETLRFEDMQEWEEWKLIGGTLTEFPSLTRLSLYKCPKLKGSIPGNLPRHTSLSVKCCPELEGIALDNLPSLSELELEECPLLMEPIHSDDNSNIIITSTSSIVFNTLRKITFINIPSLTSFPRDGLSKTLQSLSICDCENLEFLPYESFRNNKSLENLSISSSCNSMTSFTLCSLPVLKTRY